SVVKELVENAIDAQATRITIEVQAGGRSLVRVTDDGLGMSKDDALLCLERHATSKITKAEDLHAIHTMGFRGEALPSIASVSRFSLTTRERDGSSPDGTQIVVNGGKIVEVKAAGCATGTSIEVRQLFFNLPARRKFLRTEETERAHIQHYILLAALACPQIAFTLIHDGRVLWQLPSSTASNESTGAKIMALRDRLRGLHGSEQRFLDVDFTGELPAVATTEDGLVQPGQIRVWGLMGAPGVSRSTREEQHLFVNQRPVDNRGLNHALLEGYHTALMKGRFPVCCLFVEVDPAEVDVNIHPAKREVKFHREAHVRRLVAQAVRDTLLRFHSESSLSASAPAVPPPEPARALESHAQLPAFQQKELLRIPASTVGNKSEAPAAAQPALSMGFGPAPRLAPSPIATAPTQAPAPVHSNTPVTASMPPGSPAPLLAIPLRLIGVVGRLYVLLESDRGLVLLDQHAAHERILFEQMLERLEQGSSCPSQRLLLPETVELPPRDAQFVRDNLGALSRLGVGLSEFGDRTFLLDALPPFVKAKDPRRHVVELVDALKAAGQGVNSLRLCEEMIAKTVCRHAVKANDPLAGPELEYLVEDLRRCTMPYTCPHGRPTLIELNYRELERRFGRAQ
ncbi:MAG TPA: DNA mismatch repair endonuclease MutL, partial [Roseimicrobium sp.]|nr:DNA mismatch repair endonuclease MutL [Roseimicrobium sp.]